jgi:uncharacterized damage-inducible protein DinB
MPGMHQEHFRMFALYNRWANEQLYKAAATVPAEALSQDRGAYFKSLLGTLNHQLVADGIWLSRLQGNSPLGVRLDEILFGTFEPLAAARRARDAEITAHIHALEERQFTAPLTYATTSGAAQTQALHHTLAHIFNHQTHHRGQAHDLLCQIAGADAVPVIDLIAYQRYVMPGDVP